MSYLFSFSLTVGDGYSKPLDADFNADYPLVSVAEPAMRYRRITRRQKVSGQFVGRREDLARTAYPSQHLEALSG